MKKNPWRDIRTLTLTSTVKTNQTHHAISDEEELVIFFYVLSIMDGSFYISPDIVLLTIVVLIICYLLSKIWQAQLEPNFKIKGKRSVFSKKNPKFNFDFLDSSSTHHWEYTDMVLHLPLHCNICHTFLLTSKGKTKKIQVFTRCPNKSCTF